MKSIITCFISTIQGVKDWRENKFYAEIFLSNNIFIISILRYWRLYFVEFSMRSQLSSAGDKGDMKIKLQSQKLKSGPMCILSV